MDLLYGMLLAGMLALPGMAYAELPEYCLDAGNGTACTIGMVSKSDRLPHYDPFIAQIPKDAKLVFENRAPLAHTATSAGAPSGAGPFNTGGLLPGEASPPITMRDAGIYHYHCTIHPGMRGTIVVGDSVRDADLIRGDGTLPQWLRDMAGWWSAGLISDADFVSGIKFMIAKNILYVPENPYILGTNSAEIPKWIKTNAGWWASGHISDSKFVLSLQYLLKTNITKVLPSAEHGRATGVPAVAGSIVNFYLNDDDLNTSRGGVDRIPTAGLILATVSGTPIPVPPVMVETAANSGRFYIPIELPHTVNGRPLAQDDVVKVTYFDQSDYSGNERTRTSSVPLSSTFAQVTTHGNDQRIGRDFVLRLYEPDANTDSRDENRIPLSALEFRSEGGIRVPLSRSVFDASSSHLIETGPNTGTFEVTIKIPRTIDGKTVHIGYSYELRYIDSTTPSNTAEKIIYRGRIG